MTIINDIKKIFEKRKTADKVQITSIHNLRKFVEEEIKKGWDHILAYNVYNEWDNEKRNTVRKRYQQIIKDERVLVKAKYIQQLVNLGETPDIKSKSIYPEIFKAKSLEERIKMLKKMPMLKNTDKCKKQSMSLQFVVKEIARVSKELEATYKIMNEFNKDKFIDPYDMGEDVVQRLNDMLS
jgi:hypothetical protein